jgi:hypothetical protein
MAIIPPQKKKKKKKKKKKSSRNMATRKSETHIVFSHFERMKMPNLLNFEQVRH